MTTKYLRPPSLFGGVLMPLIGILLIFRLRRLMFE